MKKIIGYVATVVCFLGVCAFTGTVESYYTMNGSVVSAIDTNVTIVDEKGEVWDFVGTDFHKDEKVKITFFNNGTDTNRYDDKVKKVIKVVDN